MPQTENTLTTVAAADNEQPINRGQRRYMCTYFSSKSPLGSGFFSSPLIPWRFSLSCTENTTNQENVHMLQKDCAILQAYIFLYCIQVM